MRRITKAALGGLAGCALVLGGTQAASGAPLLQQVFRGLLTDLDMNGSKNTIGAFDSAKANLRVTERSDGSSTFSIEVEYINPEFAGQEFGSHLHTGGCTDGYDGTGPHYKRPADYADQPLREREVWLDLIPNKDGVAVYETERPFVPGDVDSVGSTMSIVIHAQKTDETSGTAGPKEVCLPLDVSTTWALP